MAGKKRPVGDTTEELLQGEQGLAPMAASGDDRRARTASGDDRRMLGASGDDR